VDQPARSEKPSRTYENRDIAVDWFPERCIHSARCALGLPDVFDPKRRPWIMLDGQPGEQPAGRTADEIAAVVARCPTGALHVRRKDGGAEEAAPSEPSLRMVRNGPLFVRGDVTVTDEHGALVRRDTRMALCRCGGSANKPFCDNTHRRIGFRDERPSRDQTRDQTDA
jgi:CDGSH-type Zn-finger protein/uncharacterized Fe-S cluster protein YjdI